jgi:beta-N-acetylhexosaminidase
MLPAILSLSGLTLSDDERALFREADPAGYVLFGRNVQDREQLRALTDALRELSGRADLPILIDQEGGPVARLKPPVWPAFPAAERFAALYERAPISAIEAARLNGLALAEMLVEVGVTVDCAPVLDLAHEGGHAVIGARSFGHEPMRVAALGRATLEGLAEGGVVGVVKHMPGHGLARADSHVELPVVEADADLLEAEIAPFRALNQAPMAMTAHVLFTAWDGERPATVSPIVIGEVIRGLIGFDGLLMSDDIAMEALDGSLSVRAAAAIGAGCDVVLHCSGVIEDSIEVVGALGEITDRARERLDRAMAARKAAGQADGDFAAKRDALLAFAEPF